MDTSLIKYSNNTLTTSGLLLNRNLTSGRQARCDYCCTVQYSTVQCVAVCVCEVIGGRISITFAHPVLPCHRSRSENTVIASDRNVSNLSALSPNVTHKAAVPAITLIRSHSQQRTFPGYGWEATCFHHKPMGTVHTISDFQHSTGLTHGLSDRYQTDRGET